MSRREGPGKDREGLGHESRGSNRRGANTTLPPSMMSKLLFSTIEVTRQAFFRSQLSFAIVNLKPIVPGREDTPIEFRDINVIATLMND